MGMEYMMQLMAIWDPSQVPLCSLGRSGTAFH